MDEELHLDEYRKNAFKKDVYELLNNAVFGKTMEIVTRRMNRQLIRGNKQERMAV